MLVSLTGANDMTKKAIRALLMPISRTLHNSHDTPDDVTIGQLKIIGRRVYQRGPGPAWSAEYSVFYNRQKIFGGDMNNIIDCIHRAVKDEVWFYCHIKQLWGDRLNVV
jgi:hypothetical protein